jgi:hypothetical protein
MVWCSCGTDASPAGTPPDAGSTPAPTTDSGVTAETDAGTSGQPSDSGTPPSTRDGGSPSDGGVPGDSLPAVDRSAMKLYESKFTAKDADARATEKLGTEQAFLDTRATPRGVLVVYLHGAGVPTTCGSAEHGRLLSGFGFHVFMPCYISDYGIVTKCGADFAACRLEAFDGADRTNLIAIARPESIEERVIRGLTHLAKVNPQGDWTFFLNNGLPRWEHIIVSGISHGASTSGIVSKIKPLKGAVMLSGPLDEKQAWLSLPSATPLQRVYGFTHTADPQHQGHLAAFEAMKLIGMAAGVDDKQAPYSDSHRLFTSAATSNGHGSTEAGGSSPKTGKVYDFEAVWKTMYQVK